ncbi:SleB-like protein [Sphingomonas hengshuiensis]|uniref:SleB-like protein n=1 Tax=Sphingomonas hengshuiensis TaxID=1609977 RepID=A0A7U5BFK8_9SPHN|nr:SleB-like protein [Sphingomonas hengshuiensis]
MLALVALVAIAVPLLLVLVTPRVVVPKHPPVIVSNRVVPKAELPPVEPVALQAVDPDDARAINASVPFSTLPNPAARAFKLVGALDSQTRAVDCLAAAVYYEAGDDAVGERAVAQVIVNRMRHPAFPKTICGVVFQGEERTTGCQFTFTCDGAMQRYMPTPAAWARARDIAQKALSGTVYKPVGHATHYHTDWVVPYWSASLEKISEVHTHLFFRWAGWWGTPPAFNRGYAGIEPNIAQMARLSPAHQASADTPLPGALGPDGAPLDPAAIPEGAIPAAMATTGADANNFLVTLDRAMRPDDFAALAVRTCGQRAYCKFMAWADPKQTPSKLPLTSAQVASMSFSYLRDYDQGFAKALWNCAQYRRPSPIQCMRAQPPALLPAPAPTATPTPGAVPDPRVAAPLPGALPGVRRKSETAPAAARPQLNLTLPGARPTPAPSPTPRPSAP